MREAVRHGPRTLAAWTAPSHWRTRPAHGEGLSHARVAVVNGHGAYEGLTASFRGFPPESIVRLMVHSGAPDADFMPEGLDE